MPPGRLAAWPAGQAATSSRGVMPPKNKKRTRKASGVPRQEPREQPREAPIQTPSLDFPIAGIGASAGGLAALKELFVALPAEPGLAFVVIQHLDPTRESLTADILSRHSRLRFVEVHDDPRVTPNCVYVIPPGKYLAIERGELHLSEPEKPRGARMAIDFFLRSLADERRDHAIAVILSGTGSDGTLGAQAIKEAGGVVIAQDPRSAEHDGMPRRAIDTGVVDLVAPPERIAEALLAYSNYAARARRDENVQAADGDSEPLSRLLRLLRAHGHHDFRSYKEATLLRRARRRAALHRMQGLNEYVEHLDQHGDEAAALASDLLINVTRFFRDTEAWQALRSQAIASIVARKDDDDPISVWVPGCATGEEAYSVALLLMEELRQVKKWCPVQVFSTDVARSALETARAGRYPQSIEADVPPELLRRYFVRVDGEDYYRAGKALREAIVFSSQDVLRDPPFSRLDLICCRNLLIYLKPEVQQKVIGLFHFALDRDGYLFLGSAETIGPHDNSFETLSKRWRLYRRLGPAQPSRVAFPAAAVPSRREVPLGSRAGGLQITHLAEHWLLDWLAPSAVLVDRKFRILHISGDVDAYLSRNPGAPNDHLLENLRKGLATRLRVTLNRAAEERRMISTAARVQRNGAYAPVSIVVRPLPGSGDDVEHLLVLFRERSTDGLIDADAAPDGREKAASDFGLTGQAAQDRGVVQQLEDELATVRSDLRATIEQLESSNEEFKAANEEVMSINEELRSTNEELETSKEELQSLNEELHTVNDQLATKVGELETKNADLENLQEATAIATICVDPELRVRWFTPAATGVIRLHRSDKGRPISDLKHDFKNDDLSATVERVLRKLTPAETEVECNDGRILLRRVTPYRTDDLRIGGAVVTLIDVTERKRAEVVIAQARDLAEKIIDTVPAPMLVLDTHFRVERVNEAFLRTFRTTRPEVIARSFYEIGGGTWNADAHALRDLLDKVLSQNESFSGYEVTATFERVGKRTMLLNAQRINHLQLILLAIEDITQRKGADDALRAGEQRLRQVIETEAVGVTFFDDHGRIIDANDTFLRMTGFSRDDVTAGELTWQKLTPPEYADATAAQLARLATTGRLGPYEKEYFRKDRSRIWMMIASSSLGDGTAVEFCIDVTGRKRAERALLEGDRRKDEFLATLAHELRNPLAPLSTAIQVLRNAPDDRATREHLYAMMERQLAHLVRLVDDLLDLARVSRGVIELKTEPLEVAGVVRTALETSAPRIESAGRKLAVELPTESLVVNADAVRLAQIVINLLNNAAKYTENDGQIWLRVQRDGEHALISVRDDGIGIAADMLPKVFEMFVQVDRSHTSGLGIGLTLARSLVRMHGGTLEAHSEGLGRGSEFIVRLPLSGVPIARSRNASNGGVDLARQKVLIVDDNRDATDSLGMMLGALGAEVQVAYDGPDALHNSETFAPDLVLLDIGMPGMDGLEVARRFRAQRPSGADAGCTLVAVTGWGQDSDRRKSARAGFDLHLTKPINMEALLEVLGERKPPLAIENAHVTAIGPRREEES
jgi:two-component system, chemotaxis family, CheB/CheR fusion protein